MSILHNNKMSSTLQQELGEYGIFHQRAVEGARKLPRNEQYFGVDDNNADDDTKLFFPKKNIDELDNHSEMEMAQLVSNENESFNLLSPTHFGKQLSAREPKTIRGYLRRLLESI